MKTSLLPRLLLAIAVLMGAAAVQAQQVFRITAIPDESPTELARKAAPLLKYLERKLGVKVEFVGPLEPNLAEQIKRLFL